MHDDRPMEAGRPFGFAQGWLSPGKISQRDLAESSRLLLFLPARMNLLFNSNCE